MTIRFLDAWNGYFLGQIVTGPRGNTEAALVASGKASYDLDGEASNLSLAKLLNDPATGGQALVDGAGNAFLRGALTSGEWTTIPSIFRLRLTGTGTVVMDSRDSLGVETLAVESYAASGATDQIEFPYAGDNAVAIRITLTGTTTAEVI